MKIKITAQNSIFGAGGKDMFGETLAIKGEAPEGWSGKYQVVEEKAEKAEPQTADDKKAADDKK